jgi:hypothetical protein
MGTIRRANRTQTSTQNTYHLSQRTRWETRPHPPSRTARFRENQSRSSHSERTWTTIQIARNANLELHRTTTNEVREKCSLIRRTTSLL